MKLQEIRDNICYNIKTKDNLVVFKDDCSCENCFYGCNKLALEIARLMGLEIGYLIKHTEQ
jgi:hypothetical protein